MWSVKPRVLASFLLIIAISLCLLQQVLILSWTCVLWTVVLTPVYFLFLTENQIIYETFVRNQNTVPEVLPSIYENYDKLSPPLYDLRYDMKMNKSVKVTLASFFNFFFSKCSKLVDDFFHGKCFISGTNFKESNNEKCVCLPDFKGENCSIPIQIFNAYADSNHNQNIQNISNTYDWSSSHLRRRGGHQRRLIHALPVNLEVELFEVRIASLYDVVDVFIIGESNLTNSGGNRDLLFLELLQGGWLKPYHDKIHYLFRGYPPPTGFEDGVKADAFMRSELTVKGIGIVHLAVIYCITKTNFLHTL